MQEVGSIDVQTADTRGLLPALIGDGRPLLALTALALLFSGAFALFLSATGQFLPHDTSFLGMTADELCAVANCRVVAFMFHDRVAFGGVLIAIGILYLWLITFPLRHGEPWAWWTLSISGAVGFTSFVAYLGYGYLDTWHGTGTLFLLPCFVAGLLLSLRTIRPPRGIAALDRGAALRHWSGGPALGRAFLLATAGGMAAAGVTILGVGVTRVFVPQDLSFMGVTAGELEQLNPRLIPLIAHDRAGFGGGLLSCGLTVGLSAWYARPSRHLWEALLLAGTAGFGLAIGVHLRVGYVDPTHLAPAVGGALLFAIGLALCYSTMYRGRARAT